MKIVRSADIEIIPASHEDLESPGVFKKIILQMADIIDGRIQMINWAFLPVGKSFRGHYHEDMQEIFILIKGEAQILVNNEQEELCEGDTVVVPAGSVHSMENVGKNDIEYIVIGVAKGTRGRTIIV
ncbi:MAG: cupin domain-containing protein [Desulfobulbaceae bacterium]|nr:cupin domain-containing protein [Desulfobulbaceae bacterium]